MENLLGCAGRKFTAKIHGDEVSGKIQVEGDRAYLCQNVRDGSDCSDKLGYKYSWVVGDGSELARSARHEKVTDFRLRVVTAEEIEAYKDWCVGDIVANENREYREYKVIFRSGELVVLKGEDGKATPNYTCDQVYDLGFRLKATPDEPVELTMDQIAEKFGVSVENLKIKKD